MTSRLLGRCARLIAIASPSVIAAGARLPASTAGPMELRLWAQAWLGPSRRLLCEGRHAASTIPEESESKFTQLDVLVKAAVCPENILQAWAEHGGNANQAAAAMNRLVQLALKDNSQLIKDPRLVNMMATIANQVSKVWNRHLVSLLWNVEHLKLAPNNQLVLSIQTQVLWQLRRFSFKELSSLVIWSCKHKGELPRKIQDAAVKLVVLRFTEISDPLTITTLMARAEQLPPELVDKLEDKALELVSTFNTEDIRWMCLSLAHLSRRSVPVLKAMSYQLIDKSTPSQLDTKLLLDLAYVYAKLNFQHTKALQMISSQLITRMPELKSVEVVSCAKSMSFLKWINRSFLERVTQHYMVNSHQYYTDQLCNLIMSFAKLGFQPINGEEFFQKVHPVLESYFSTLDPLLQIDVLWSLCVLQQAKPQYFTSLMKLPGLARLRDAYRLKLLHIKTTLQLEHPEFTGTASSPPGVLPSFVPGSDTSRPSILQSELKLALERVVMQRAAAVRTGVHTVYGWTIDGELVVDSENKPVDLVSLTAPHLPSGGGDKPLPVGARRLAFLAWDFPHFGFRVTDLLGRFAMKKRHLQRAGFIIVEVPYYEWVELKSDDMKDRYLKQQMWSAVAGDMCK